MELSKPHFNFQTAKKNLLAYLINRNKTESQSFEELIKNYNILLVKIRGLSEKAELLERENNSLKRISGDPAIMNDLQFKVQSLERELNETMKENKNTSGKLCEILTDKMMMKDQIDSLSKQNSIKQSRIQELEEIVGNQDAEINKLREDNNFLKNENAKLERQNITLNENLNKKMIENNNLINEILAIKEDYILKMNEMNELVENAKKRKEAADIYFDEKKKEHGKSTDKNPILEIRDFQVFVEDVQIPNKLKIKLSGHKKNITSLKFNNFGTNFISTGVDNFVKIWDAAKSILVYLFIFVFSILFFYRHGNRSFHWFHWSSHRRHFRPH